MISAGETHHDSTEIRLHRALLFRTSPDLAPLKFLTIHVFMNLACGFDWWQAIPAMAF